MPSNTERVFLCHNSLDKPIVRRLKELLKANGIQAWMDECDLDGGSDWQDELGEALIQSRAVVICLGPNAAGRWQKQEIKVVVQQRIEANATVVPLILPSCGQTDPDIPIWLKSVQCIDLRKDEIDADPFGRLLRTIDARDPVGHFRPSLLMLRKTDDETSHVAAQSIQSACHSELLRLRSIDPSETLLEKRLTHALEHTDVLVSILSPDSYNAHPVATFSKGIADGARRLAENAGVEVIQWRSDAMLLPEDPALRARFTSTTTDTSLPTDLRLKVMHTAVTHFDLRKHLLEVPISETSVRTVLGYPRSGKKFVRTVAEHLGVKAIQCDSLAKWSKVTDRLRKCPPIYKALIVVLTGDDEWLDECTEWLEEFEDMDLQQRLHHLPAIRAFLHDVEDKSDADPIPIHPREFEEYYGAGDLTRLTDRIKAIAGQIQ